MQYLQNQYLQNIRVNNSRVNPSRITRIVVGLTAFGALTVCTAQSFGQSRSQNVDPYSDHTTAQRATTDSMDPHQMDPHQPTQPATDHYEAPPYYPSVDEQPDEQIECKEEPADRDGMTLRASMGGGFTALLYDEGDSQSYPGWNVLNLGVGTFFSPNLALLLDGSFIWFGSFTFALENGFVASLGPTVQWWFADWISVEGGVGLGVNYIEYRNGPSFTQFGPQFGAGLNVSLFSGEHNAVGLYTKAMMVPSRDSTLSMQFGVAWQMF